MYNCKECLKDIETHQNIYRAYDHSFCSNKCRYIYCKQYEIILNIQEVNIEKKNKNYSKKFIKSKLTNDKETNHKQINHKEINDKQINNKEININRLIIQHEINNKNITIEKNNYIKDTVINRFYNTIQLINIKYCNIEFNKYNKYNIRNGIL